MTEKKICPLMSRAGHVVVCKEKRCMLWQICREIGNFVPAPSK